MGSGLVWTEKLNKYFGKVHALRDLTLSIGGGITGGTRYGPVERG